jgi:hypothetical protein
VSNAVATRLFALPMKDRCSILVNGEVVGYLVRHGEKYDVENLSRSPFAINIESLAEVRKVIEQRFGDCTLR